jgi:signal transduction histidine kinase/CheY-like chemotaxis protein
MSLRLRVAVFLSVALLVILLLASYAWHVHDDLHKKLERTRATSSELIHLTEKLDSHFQKQLLAWSNLLLRGLSPDEYHRYLQAFYQQERETRSEIKNLNNKLDVYTKTTSEIEAFSELHNAIGLRFRKALTIYNQSESPIYDADRFIWSDVKDPFELLSRVKSNILEKRQQQLIQGEKEAGTAKRLIIIYALLTVICFIAVFIWLTDIYLGKPLTKTVNVARKVSAGDYSQRVNDKMPGEFNLFATAFNQMMDSLTQANKDLQDNMQVLRNEIVRREQLEIDLEQKKHAAEGASRAKSEFLSNVNHEIRTPLHVVTGYAQLLATTDTSEKQKKYIKSILSGSDSLMNIVNDVLDLAKIESGKLNIERRMFDLHELLHEVEAMFIQLSAKKGLSFQLSIAQDVPRVIYTDINRLKQILLNLLSNAIKFTVKGDINLSVYSTSTVDSHHVDLRFSVEDSGIGIPKEHHQRIFNQFEQQDGQDARKYGGTGLGLAISLKLAQLLKGNLTVRSTPDIGSVFTLNLYEVESSEELPVTNDDTEQLVPRLNAAKILIADDLQENRELIMNVLEDQPVEFFEAENGRQAIEAACQHQPDLILMDIKMPEMDGIDATRAIKADNELKHIPVVAITASSLQEDNLPLQEILFDGYLTKPVKMLSLLNVLSHLLKA